MRIILIVSIVVAVVYSSIQSSIVIQIPSTEKAIQMKYVSLDVLRFPIAIDSNPIRRDTLKKGR
jgi:hypothetical protein